VKEMNEYLKCKKHLRKCKDTKTLCLCCVPYRCGTKLLGSSSKAGEGVVQLRLKVDIFFTPKLW
jgi:hypothetical protein